MNDGLRNKTTIMSCALVCLGAVAVAAPQTWYVAVTNNGPSDGLTWSTAWTNLQQAVDQAESGDALCVMTGRYGIAAQIVVSNKTLTLRGGMLITSGSVHMENITVTDNTTCGVSGPGTIINSILWNNGLDVEGALEISYSCISNGTYSDQGYNIAENPRFQNAAAGNYRLIRNESTAMTSPCIDAGSNAAWMTGAFDLDGRPRIMRGDTTAAVSRVDMGAYEVSPLAGTILVLR